MTIPVIAVVLRLGALYVLWWGLRATVQFFVYSTESDTIRIATVTLVLCVAVAAGLWVYAKALAAVLYPYEMDAQAPLALDVDRLEVMVVQLAGVILIVSALLDAITVLHRIVVTAITFGPTPQFGESLTDNAWLVGTALSALLTATLGLVLIVKVDGLLAILRKLRRLG